MSAQLNVTEVFTGKRLLFAGATGFLGKVSLSMLLHRYGEVLDKIYVLVRRGSSPSAERRFYDKIVPSEPFDPLRQKWGETAMLELLRSKCEVLDGDLTHADAGLSKEQVAALTGRVDAVINCAGLVSFNPSLEVGLKVNTHGVRNVTGLCLKWDAPLVHMSTAFVAGKRDGLVFEDEEIRGYFPRKDELDPRDFSLDGELQDCDRLVARLREQAEDETLTSTFRQRAIERLESEGRDTSDEKAMRLAVGRERKLWLSSELTRAGMERAKHWGWPNTYTYTKSLGEQVLVGTEGLTWAIVRPSIVESALRYPFPGWNEGFTTSAPLAFMGMKGQRGFPMGDQTVLDIIPVDLVAGSLIAITAHTLQSRRSGVYHQASGDTSPFYASRSLELVALYRRRHYRNRKSGNAFWNALMSKVEPVSISKRAFDLRSAPLFAKGARLLKEGLSEVKPTWGAPKLSALLERADDALSEIEHQARSVETVVDLFLPFTWENRYIFRCDNTRALYARMAPSDAEKIPWDPEALDWRSYFLEVHLPGLEKWVFPGLEEEREKRTVIPAHRDLLELFDAAVHAFRHRVAFRLMEGEREEHFTFGEVWRYAARVASFLAHAGVKPKDRVLLISENRPEWAMSYFGILRAGATVVPVDPLLSDSEVVNIVRRSEAACCLISEEASRELSGLHRKLSDAGVATQLHALAQAMAGDPSAKDGISDAMTGAGKKSVSPDDVASLIFTSGTTGNPKGVMLTHRNFASLVAKLAGTFDIGVGDGLLSVLPLHHTFEFSCGLLTPFSRGAEVTYLDELNADRLGEALSSGRITAMIGVPALWQLLHRKITQELAARPAWIEQGIRALMGANAELRNRSPLNLGKLLFWPVHRKLGGKLRFMVSGGSALSDEVHEAFHAMGFDIAEGYGLTEAAPVLAVSQLTNARLKGTVGKSLPGIQLRISEPDADGIGEVWAKGPNVMAGYYGDEASTSETIEDGWLKTGDLGRLDDEGRLFLMGRKKDVIIDANGKNVYPDELEELYGVHPHIEELSVVGLPDEAGGEKVACLCVPAYKERPPEEVREEVEAHFKKISGELPFYRRIKVLKLWDGTLPRTSTRKVKRKEVVAQLQKLDRSAARGKRAREKGAEGGDWLVPLIAEVIGKPTSEIHLESNLSTDLGFDSLMLTELSTALEHAGVPLQAVSDLGAIQTVDDLRKLVAASGKRPDRELRAKEISDEVARAEETELHVPEGLATLGRSLLSFGQKVLYGGVFDVKVTGKSFIPPNRNFIVIANHTSHLDMGLVKVVLGEQGEKLVALAARDYFFDTPLKRAYFENFTQLIPMDRSGSLRESLKLAAEALDRGLHLLIFPEGTRSPSGELQEFKPTLGYLALTARVDVLPLWLEGTHRALPKGAILPKEKSLEVRIGPALDYATLRERTQGMSRSERYRAVTALCEEAVRALAAGKVLDLDAMKKDEAASGSRSRRAGAAHVAGKHARRAK